MIESLIRNVENRIHSFNDKVSSFEVFENDDSHGVTISSHRITANEDTFVTNAALNMQFETFKNLSTIYSKENSKLLSEMELIFSEFNKLMYEVRQSKQFRNYYGDGTLFSVLESVWKKVKEVQSKHNRHRVISIAAKLRFMLESRFPQLTETEFQVTSLIWAGFSTTHIAEVCIISERTIENHRMHIRKKLQIPKGCTIADHLKKFSNEGS